MPFVRNRFLAAYEKADLRIPHGAYIRVWNLLYLCNPTLKDAIASYATIKDRRACESEDNVPRLVWFAWGPPNPKLSILMSRFTDRAMEQPFYYDILTHSVESCKPKLTNKVKHTQDFRRSQLRHTLLNVSALTDHAIPFESLHPRQPLQQSGLHHDSCGNSWDRSSLASGAAYCSPGQSSADSSPTNT